MGDDMHKALASVRLSWAPTPEDVWQGQSGVHVPGLHDTTTSMVLQAFDDANASTGASPLGVVVRGAAGTGKTHLLGHVRKIVQDKGGYFFLIRMIDASEFWRTIVVQMLEDFTRPASAPEHDNQLRLLLWRLATIAGVSRVQRRAIIGTASVDPETLDVFVNGLYRKHPHVVRHSRNVMRALVLYASVDLELQDVGESYLLSSEETKDGERVEWGITGASAVPQEIAMNISRLLALTGPTLLAVDQIDPLVARSANKLGSTPDKHPGAATDGLADGLMSLRENMFRTVPVLSCTPTSWEIIEDRAIATVTDRFRRCPDLKGLPTAEFARVLLEKRLRPAYDSVGFRAPYPTWPVTEQALEHAPEFTPRNLLRAVDNHIQRCLRQGTIAELTDLRTGAGDPGEGDEPVSTGHLDGIDARFEALRRAAITSDATDPASEDLVVPQLLAVGLDAWIRETGAPDGTYRRDPVPGAKPALHARLRRTLDAATEDEEHWAFRAIAASNATASMNRIQKACTASGLGGSVPGRRLILVRNTAWPTGAKTRASIAAFEAAGGRVLPLRDEDARVLAALRTLFDDNPQYLDEWLAARRPAHGLELFRAALADAERAVVEAPVVEAPVVEAPAVEPPTAELAATVASVATQSAATQPGAADADAVPSIPIGTALDTGEDVRIPLEAFRKHTAIFAGSGSGKTVLIRRIVEECALQGVSSIVLDPNNDLARLGTGWPAGSREWTPGDDAKAAEYLENTEVLVWTPRITAGRPLSFQPLPQFASVVDDRDEFGFAVDSAVASLVPRAMADGRTARAQHAQAVLKQALEYFGRGSAGDLNDFVALLEDFPDDVSDMKNAVRIAADLAENLKASMATDPMFGGAGAPVDPGVLLTPTPGRRARVSVINFSGLPSDVQRQGFVNQLQMALFAWIKKNPAGERPLGGLFVMDEAQTFAPSGPNTACTQSTLALASQARKYGLGLVFATQAPKGLNNRIPGNAATQFFGLLNSPAQIDTAKEMARSKGGAVPDVGKMPTGHFYTAVEGAEFRKVRTPLCLTYHPKSPPTQEEVVVLARGGSL